MVLPCSYYRYSSDNHGCEIHGDCAPIRVGPDLSGCPSFHHPSVKKMAETKKEPCAHLGEWTGETIPCKTCRGNVFIKILKCSVHGECTIGKKMGDKACCKVCPDYQAVCTGGG